jgi:hypothetical protein
MIKVDGENSFTMDHERINIDSNTHSTPKRIKQQSSEE